MLGLHCCAHAFSSCDGQASHHGGFPGCGAWAQKLGLLGSRAQAQELWCTGLVAPRHIESSRPGIKPCALHWQVDS